MNSVRIPIVIAASLLVGLGSCERGDRPGTPQSASQSATAGQPGGSAGDILQKVSDAYAAMQTYKAEGTITSQIETAGDKRTVVTAFSILLKKPNLYRISWAQKNMPRPGMAQSGAVWSDGTQPYLYMGMMNAYSKMGDDQTAISGATGISGGATFTIPSLFLPAFKKWHPLVRLKDLKIEGTQKVAGEECYVLSGPSSASKKETLWISKSSFLIRQYSRSLEAPQDGFQVSKMTDEDLKDAVKALGQEATKDSVTKMKEMMESSRTMLQTMALKGISTELHANVSSPDLSTEDFRFELPKGTVLKESLFGGMFGGSSTKRGLEKGSG